MFKKDQRTAHNRRHTTDDRPKVTLKANKKQCTTISLHILIITTLSASNVTTSDKLSKVNANELTMRVLTCTSVSHQHGIEISAAYIVSTAAISMAFTYCTLYFNL